MTLITLCREPMTLIDCHTHDLDSLTGVISLQPSQLGEMRPGRVYSVGIHPWYAAMATESDLQRLSEVAEGDNVVMIGESGLDGLCDTPADVQERAFRAMIALSERVGKPLVVHAVKCFPRIIGLHRELRPSQPWIIHGFRGKPELARELLREGFYISLGERYNEAVPAVVDADRLLRESDEGVAPPYDERAVANLGRLIGREVRG